MPTSLKSFQQDICAGIVARLENVREVYRGLNGASPATIAAARKRDGAVVLQAPTGSGKTLIAVEALRRFSRDEAVLWFWFAPFAGLVEQSRSVIGTHAPELKLFDMDSDRRLDTVTGGGVFVTTWASVAASSAVSRRARVTGDSGLSVDALIAQARAAGVRIGCVVDEAHHGFHRAAQARAFFSDVLEPDYTLMMTATPRDRDAILFEQQTGYRIGEPADWASVSRFDAVQAGLLKQGVRMVRFLAGDGDAEQLIDFEHLALRECAVMHRHIRRELGSLGIALTPLMLVQVPDGAEAQRAAQRYLVDSLGFSAEAVRVHTSSEPDPDLIALANDPSVEVLIFKMAVAIGFDAPRAYTLAALRGARDAAFGVQVIGRIVRRHALVQTRDDLPAVLDHGYVFLANAKSQEGLLDAGAEINALTTRAPEIGTQTVVTVIGDIRQVQVARSGEPLSLLVAEESPEAIVGSDASSVVPGPSDIAGGQRGLWAEAARDLLQLAGDEGEGVGVDGGLERRPMLTLARTDLHRYERRADAPSSLRTERLPKPPADYEAQLVDHVDFSNHVLADRLRSNERVRRDETDLFEGQVADGRGEDIFAELAPEAVAEKAEQIRLRLADSNDRELQERLLARFSSSIRQSGAQVPADEEVLSQQLDLTIVRNPRLLRDAFTRLRHSQVVDADAPLEAEIQCDMRLEPATRGLYGVYPPGMNEDEKAIAVILDSSPLVRWWHRNPADARRADAVGLYRWDDGAGFFPDFVVSLNERQTPGGIALIEVKGEFLWGSDHEVEKASARHSLYGPVFMIGRERGHREFVHLRRLGDRLASDGVFSLDRLRHL